MTFHQLRGIREIAKGSGLTTCSLEACQPFLASLNHLGEDLLEVAGEGEVAKRDTPELDPELGERRSCLREQGRGKFGPALQELLRCVVGDEGAER
jgi:hypothetical protein